MRDIRELHISLSVFLFKQIFGVYNFSDEMKFTFMQQDIKSRHIHKKSISVDHESWSDDTLKLLLHCMYSFYRSFVLKCTEY